MTRLTVRSGPSHVINRGPEPHTTVGVAGFGIDGMRERARLCGGELTAGSDPEGGFTIRAVLPTAVTA